MNTPSWNRRNSLRMPLLTAEPFFASEGPWRQLAQGELPLLPNHPDAPVLHFDVKEDENALYIELTVADVVSVQLNVGLVHNNLLIGGQIKSSNVTQEPEEQAAFLQIFKLPVPIATARAQAAPEGAILRLILPKHVPLTEQKVCLN